MTDLQSIKYAPSTTPRNARKRCPECKSVNIRPQFPEKIQSHGAGKQYLCGRCLETFDEPVREGAR